MAIHPYMLSDQSTDVTSVNGQTGVVNLDATDVSAQPISPILTNIASITMPSNSFLVMNTDGTSFAPQMAMPAGLAWLTYTTVDQQKAELALATVASSGAYSDLSGCPTISSVGLSGSYTDLTNKPTIPAQQVSSDWNATSGVAQVLNKPSLFSSSYTDLTNKPALFDGTWTSLSGKPTTFTPSAHNQAWSTITATPTTISGYGITDGVTPTSLTTTLGGYTTSGALSTALSSYVLTATYTAGLATKYTTPAGTTSQYVRGDGSLATLPIANVVNQSSVTRALNTAFQVSTTRNVLVNYSVLMTVTASISGGQNGDVIFEIASDSGFTANVQTVAIAGLSQVYTLAIALLGVQGQTCVVSGMVPQGYYARLRTVNTTGTPTFAYRAGQEILL